MNNYIKTWLIVNIAIVALLAGAILFLNSEYSKSKSQYNQILSDNDGFNNSKIFPSEENYDLKSEQVDALTSDFELLKKDFAKYNHFDSSGNFSSQFTDVVSTTKSYLDDKSTGYEAKSLFGFEDYANKNPEGELEQDLLFSLNAISEFIKVTADSGVSNLVSVHREKLASELGEREDNANSILKSYAFQVVVSGKESKVIDLLNLIKTQNNVFVVVEAIKIQSEGGMPLIIKEEVSNKASASSVTDSILGGVETAEITEKSIQQVAGDSDLFMAMKINFVKNR